jgi:hypothetical protein
MPDTSIEPRETTPARQMVTAGDVSPPTPDTDWGDRLPAGPTPVEYPEIHES